MINSPCFINKNYYTTIYYKNVRSNISVTTLLPMMQVPDEVKAALESDGELSPEASECLRFPLSCGDLRYGLDKRGQACSIVDCVFNTQVVTSAGGYRGLKKFLVELVVGHVQQKVRGSWWIVQILVDDLCMLVSGSRCSSKDVTVVKKYSDYIPTINLGMIERFSINEYLISTIFSFMHVLFAISSNKIRRKVYASFVVNRNLFVSVIHHAAKVVLLLIFIELFIMVCLLNTTKLKLFCCLFLLLINT